MQLDLKASDAIVPPSTGQEPVDQPRKKKPSFPAFMFPTYLKYSPDEPHKGIFKSEFLVKVSQLFSDFAIPESNHTLQGLPIPHDRSVFREQGTGF